MTKGKLFLILSAFFYGVLPIFASYAYRGGMNGITLSFLRCFLSTPILYAMIRADGKELKLTVKQFRSMLKLSVVGGALPIVLLYISYNYIPTGIATTLHFIYPIVIILVSALIYHEKIPRSALCAVILVTIGIFMFSDISVKVRKIGIVLSLLSGIFYSFYIIYIDRSGLDRMDCSVLTFYVMLTMSITIFLFGCLTKTVSFDFKPLSWSMALLISLITTLGAMPLLQAGIRYEGSETAGIISAIEPITTVVLGTVFLGEIIGTSQIMGGSLIVFGVLLSQRSRAANISR